MNIGYIRVSTKEQNEGRQLEGIPLDIEPFIDKISGATKERPALKECMIALRKGDTLYVHSMDRLARDLGHLQQIVEHLIDKGVTIKFIQESMTFEGSKDNPMSMLLLQIMGAVAQFGRKAIKRNQLEGIALAKQKGTRTGKPFGNQPLDMKRREEALQLKEEGLSNRKIALEMRLSRPSIAKLLA
jgi:DNA invertase Pin-like site-specific DNA recombinase